MLEYVEAWMDSIVKNDGIIPDNIGPNGQIGEKREGQWWGGIHGWNRSYYTPEFRILIGLAIGAECGQLLTGDYGYLDLLLSRITEMVDRRKKRDDGQLVVPTRHGLKAGTNTCRCKWNRCLPGLHGDRGYRDDCYLWDNEVEGDFTKVTSHGVRGGVTLETRF